MRLESFDAAISTLPRVTKAQAEKLAQLGLQRISDLLFHFPLRYQDKSQVVPVANLLPGTDALLVVEVMQSEVVFRRRRSLVCRVQDATGIASLRFFYFGSSLQKSLSVGTRLQCFGHVSRDGQFLSLVHPEFKVLEDGEAPTLETGLTPIYPAGEGLKQSTLKRLVGLALDNVAAFADVFPEVERKQFGFPPLSEALRLIHRPDSLSEQQAVLKRSHPAISRFIFEELLAHHLSMGKIKQSFQTHAAPVLPSNARFLPAFLRQLPFELTRAQQRVNQEVAEDIQRAFPMMRLVQGDVGSGKTVVAACACLLALENDFQAALMAPTELLAEQHAQNFQAWLAPLGIEVVFLGGKLRAKPRRLALEAIADGRAQVIIGTHALFQEQVQFQRLGLVVIDEQHRFGVHQRLALRDKGLQDGMAPHQLIMTATPIPRTLAMTAYADMDYSVIDELPPGRTAVTTVAISEQRRAEVIERIAAACAEGRQVYWVCTLIEESEALQCQAAEDAFAELSEALSEQRVGLVHGRMKALEKEAVMQAFKAQQLDLLVATTVIEVGVDVPNASLMVIENAERLGLAQLHQLRGRVGRGSTASSCVLMYKPPLGKTGKQRLDAMRQTTDGFRIAEIDLQLRGPGEVLGVKQTGDIEFAIADLEQDQAWIPEVKACAQRLLATQPEVADQLVERWLGFKQHYRAV